MWTFFRNKQNENQTDAKSAQGCYIGIATLHSSNEISNILNGSLDMLFIPLDTNEIQPSTYFEVRCKVFNTFETAVLQSRGTEISPNHVYILEMGYNSNEVQSLAAQGLFSKGIKAVINCGDCHIPLNKNLKELNWIENANFQADLRVKNLGKTREY